MTQDSSSYRATVYLQGKEYRIQVTVSVPNPAGDGATLGFSYATTSVLVGTAGVDAVISGGEEQSFSATADNIVMSAENSVDLDYTDQGTTGLGIKWVRGAISDSWC